MKPSYYIIDFDSTITQVEALEELADISLQDRPDKNKVIQEIANLTNLAMEGKLSFEESLKKRVQLLGANQSHIKDLVKRLKKKITHSFARNLAFFRQHSAEVLVVSGGFKEFIEPVVKSLLIEPKQIYANTFVFDEKGNIVGFDEKNPLCKEGGKVLLLKELDLKGEVFGIGDGFSDFQLKESGFVKKFFAFTENIERKIVKEKADTAVVNFDEFLFINKLPRSLSYPKNRIVLAAVGDIPDASLQIFEKEKYTIVRAKDINEGEVNKKIGMMIASPDVKIDDDFILNHPILKVIGFLGDIDPNINTDLASQNGIVIFDAPESRVGKTKFIPKRMINFINKGDTHFSCNMPAITLPEIKNTHRLIHIHHNVPGILRQINEMIWKKKGNILGQYLRAEKQVGYVIIDIDLSYDESLLKDLKNIEETIKFRVLY